MSRPPQYWRYRQIAGRLVLLFGCIAIIWMSFSMTVIGQSQVFLPGVPLPLPETCTMRMLFGFSCPGCGLTRAFISISHGRLADAWRFNPASFLMYLTFAAAIPWQLLQITRLLCSRNSIESNWLYAIPIGLGLLLVIQWLLRMTTVSG